MRRLPNRRDPGAVIESELAGAKSHRGPAGAGRARGQPEDAFVINRLAANRQGGARAAERPVQASKNVLTELLAIITVGASKTATGLLAQRGG